VCDQIQSFLANLWIMDRLDHGRVDAELEFDTSEFVAEEAMLRGGNYTVESKRRRIKQEEDEEGEKKYSSRRVAMKEHQKKQRFLSIHFISLSPSFLFIFSFFSISPKRFFSFNFRVSFRSFFFFFLFFVFLFLWFFFKYQSGGFLTHLLSVCFSLSFHSFFLSPFFSIFRHLRLPPTSSFLIWWCSIDRRHWHCENQMGNGCGPPQSDVSHSTLKHDPNHFDKEKWNGFFGILVSCSFAGAV